MIQAILPCSHGTTKNYVGTSNSGHMYYKLSGFFYKKIEGPGPGGDFECNLHISLAPPSEITALDQVASIKDQDEEQSPMATETA